MAKPEAKSKAKKKPPPRFSAAWWRSWGGTFITAAIIFITIRTFFVAAFVITSGSMESTLLVGDFLLVNRLGLGPTIPLTGIRIPGYSEPKHGDIIVFRNDHSPGLDIVKRALGLPGDTLRMERGVLYRNGVAVDEPYARRRSTGKLPVNRDMLWQVEHLTHDAERTEYKPSRNDWGPIVIPGERYFMLGDNRDNSQDSRMWGFVERRNMRGTPLFIYYSYDKDALRPVPFVTALRLSRIGRSPQ